MHLGGSESAPLVITEFMDFTCPYCAGLAAVTDSLLQSFPDQFSVVFHHFPLTGRDLSMPSAVAAECAGEQGHFNDMYQTLFANRDGIGSINWRYFGEEAGVPDLEIFEACVARPAQDFEQIQRGRTIGEETGVRGTPTVWLNGQVVSARTVEEFVRLASERGFELTSNE